jgi:ADP-ribose pyrophosphatase YjhB (NUDIX family)
MDRAQCIVHRGNALLLVRHRRKPGDSYWCLPGGGVRAGETPAEAAIRELKEECCVDGTVLSETSVVAYLASTRSYSKAYTFLVDIGDQEPHLGADPEFEKDRQLLIDVQWMTLSEIPERDRAFLWAAGILAVEEFHTELSTWGHSISYPPSETE